MNLFKKTIALLSLTVFLTSFVPCALASEVYLEEIVEEKSIVRGVSYQRRIRLDDTGWQDIHIVRADLTEPYLKFNVLRDAQGVSFLDNTLESAKANDTVAAINADFFAAKRGQAGRGSPVGMEVIDGVLNSTSATAEDMNVLYQLKEDGTLHLNSFTFDITVTAPNGVSEKVSALNKYDDMNGLVMYTDAWNNVSLGTSGAIQEIVVDDKGKVIDKRWDSEPAEIPKGGYILTSDLTKNTFIDDNLQVGDEVTIEITTAPDYNKIENAVGGGGVILANGKVPSSFSHNIGGYQPRSAVGIDETGKIITLVAVDGRRSEAKGMTQTQLGYLMAELGCYNALNLDGGGSTALVLKNDGEQKVANTPSDGGLRQVTNSIGITSDAEISELYRIELKSDDENVFKNTSRWVWIEAFDEFDHKLEINDSKINWSVIDGQGYMEGDIFHPTGAGKAIIRAEYEGKTAEFELLILDIPHRMKFSSEKLELKSGASELLWLDGWDSEGRKAKIYPKDTDFVIDEPIAKLADNKITAESKGATKVSANFGAVSANMALMVDGAEEISVSEGAKIADPQNKSAELSDDGFRFTVFGNTRTPEKLFDMFMMNTAIATMQENGTLHGFVGSDFDESTVKMLGGNYFTARMYQTFTHENSTFITLKNTAGTIASGGFDQWSKFKYDVNTAKGDNLFIFVHKNNISTNAVEKKNFARIVETAAQNGKNVYVFGGGFKNESYLENGVRYVNTAGVFPSIGLKPPANNISYVKYLLVTVNGVDITYEWKNILDQGDE
ncbi:MAG: phosphodiester glycosidase family protein [Clostridia bacterium]|nr:phosphodiester glycosidase family protein [Clostridia bacterium]